MWQFITDISALQKRNRDLCWLRQRDTYPATVVAPLSKGDAASVTFVYTVFVPTILIIMVGSINIVYLSRPFGTQLSDAGESRHCAFGLYRVIDSLTSLR